MKKIIRLTLALMVFSYIGLESNPDYFLSNKAFGAILITLGAVSGLIFWGCLVWNWFKTNFSNGFVKAGWLLTLLFLYFFIGPIIYYIGVIEFKRSVKKLKQ